MGSAGIDSLWEKIFKREWRCDRLVTPPLPYRIEKNNT
jgi:hypothetical protein